VEGAIAGPEPGAGACERLGEDGVAELLRSFPTLRLTVTGSCMAPLLMAGEAVRVARDAPPRFGDVVLVRLPDGLRLHRVVWPPWPNGAGLRTQADRNAALDPRPRPRGVLGVVVGVEGDERRRVRRPVVALRSLARALLRRASLNLAAEPR
jgi:hypothetical protein